ncbi:MAG: YIP1 family protein [Rhodovulum sp.]|nr:YIP1 family protein [Rhodovulum sp.]
MPDLKTLFIDLTRLTLREPRKAAARVLAMPFPRPVLWQALALVVVLGAIQTIISDYVVLFMAGPGATLLFAANPLFTSVMALGGTVVMVHSIHRIGVMFGGRGDLDGALKIAIWVQAVLLLFNTAQLILMLFAPVLSALMGMVNVGILFWLMTVFIAVLHGFQSYPKVLLGIFLSALMLGMAFIILLSVTGLSSVLGV